MSEHPVCHVCQEADASVRPVALGIMASRTGLKSPQTRSRTYEVEVCGRCWGEADLTIMAHSVRGLAAATIEEGRDDGPS